MLDMYIGIDPGESNGVAVFDKQNGLRLYTLSFWKLIKYIQEKVMPAYREAKIIPHFIVENPNLNGFMYQQRTNEKGKSVAMRMAQNVGMNKADAKRIIQLLTEEYGLVVDEVKPQSGSAKWDANLFSRMYGQEVKCSQHARDAAKLIAKHWLK